MKIIIYRVQQCFAENGKQAIKNKINMIWLGMFVIWQELLGLVLSACSYFLYFFLFRLSIVLYYTLQYSIFL